MCGAGDGDGDGDGDGPSRISYAAYWQDDNDNPALAHFLKLLEERYPLLSNGD